MAYLAHLIRNRRKALLLSCINDEDRVDRVRQWYVRPLNVVRMVQSEFRLVEDMREMDPERHFQYFRQVLKIPSILYCHREVQNEK